jgi:hypothetical protein
MRTAQEAENDGDNRRVAPLPADADAGAPPVQFGFLNASLTCWLMLL